MKHTKKRESKTMKDFREPCNSFKWLNINEIGVPWPRVGEREEIFEQELAKKIPN